MLSQRDLFSVPVDWEYNIPSDAHIHTTGLAEELIQANSLWSGQKEENVLYENLVFLKMKQISDVSSELCLKNLPTERSSQYCFPKYHACTTSQLTTAQSGPDPFPSHRIAHISPPGEEETFWSLPFYWLTVQTKKKTTQKKVIFWQPTVVFPQHCTQKPKMQPMIFCLFQQHLRHLFRAAH